MSVKEQLSDLHDRNLARFTFDSNIVVRAGAGTGKTTLLIDRLCYLILGEKAADENFTVENVVALTFTRKAAAEIKTRLAYRLNAVIKEITLGKKEDASISSFVENLKSNFGQDPQSIVENAKKALFLLDRSQIGVTIHGFASSILRSFALYAGIDPSFEEDEGKKFDEIFRYEFAKWLEAELDTGSPRQEKWKFVLKHIELEDINIFTRKLCGAKFENCKTKNPSDFLPLCKKKLAEIKKLKERYFDITKSEKIRNGLISAEEAVTSLMDAIEKDDFENSSPLYIPFPDRCLRGWSKEDFEEAKSLVKFAQNASVFNQKIVSVMLELVKPFARIFSLAYGKKGFVSFDGLLIKARDLVKNNRYARGRLKEKYRYILIDEFQDTDPLQGEIILFLGEGGGSFAPNWQDVKLCKGKLFIVGDDKQSIYRFRGADITAYDKFTSLVESQGAVKCFLHTNFRSQKSLSETVNFLVSKVMQKDDKQCEYVPIFADRKALTKNSFELVLTTTTGAARADDYRKLEADFIADWICANVDKPLFEGAGNLRLKDIAVFFRSMSSLDIYLEALKRREINYSVEEDRYFYCTQEIIDLVNLLKTVLNPDDKVSLVGVLRSPLAAFDDGEIYGFRKAGLLNYKVDCHSKFGDLKRFYLKLRKFNALLGRASMSEFINILTRQMRAFEVLSAAYNGEQTVSNIFKFISIISGFDELSCEKLDEFLNPSAGFANSAREGESSIVDESLDAINIMTIHKAKGLEFPVVILADINSRSEPTYVKNKFLYDWYSNTAGFGVSSFKDIALSALQEDEKKHSLAEEVRIFYVALTRARDKLVLVGSNQKPKKNTVARYLDKSLAFADIDAETSQIKPEGLKFPLKVTSFGGVGWKSLRRARDKVSASNISKWNLSWQSRLHEFDRLYGQEIFVSPTSLRKKTQDKLFEKEVRFCEYGGLFGVLCHKILEFHDFKGKFDFEEIENTLYALSLDFQQKADASLLIKKAFETLNGFALSEEYLKITSSAIIARELAFDYLYEKNGDAFVMRGVIDLITKTAGKICVMDYKSEFVLRGQEPSRALEFKDQCEIYKSFVSKLFPNLPICSKVLFLVTGEGVEV
jgi:ATP-dependent helicase/nuclease subunit A